MAKYTRFDPRNKKRNKHKNQYLDRTKSAQDRRPRMDDEEEDSSLYERYRLEKFSNLY